MAHTCDAVVVSCIDFRIQGFIDAWIKEKLGERNHDQVAWAGGVQDWDNVFNQIELSKKLHDIKRVVLMNHEECGAYGEAGTPEKHAQDLKAAKNAVLQKYQDMEVLTFFVHLDGNFEAIT